MSRSLKKGPYVEPRLLGRVQTMNKRNEKRVLKTWSRASVIFPDFIGHTVAVYNGKKHIPVYVPRTWSGTGSVSSAPPATTAGTASTPTARRR
jgi:small subunit ribosomal protein S19